MSNDFLNQLLTRRSVLANNLSQPGPSAEQRDQILGCGHRVPDHGKIAPWRFILFEGDSRSAFGKVLAEVFQDDNPDASEQQVVFERARFERAPLIIAVVSSPIEHKVPEWEQRLCAGAVCQNILHGAYAFGFGAQWLTEWYAYHAKINHALSLSDKESIAGFIYIGTAKEKPAERKRPDLAPRISHWQ